MVNTVYFVDFIALFQIMLMINGLVNEVFNYIASLIFIRAKFCYHTRCSHRRPMYGRRRSLAAVILQASRTSPGNPRLATFSCQRVSIKPRVVMAIGNPTIHSRSVNGWLTKLRCEMGLARKLNTYNVQVRRITLTCTTNGVTMYKVLVLYFAERMVWNCSTADPRLRYAVHCYDQQVSLK